MTGLIGPDDATTWTGGMIGWQLGKVMRDPHKLRELAIWYREFAERAGNPAVWEARLLTAEELEQEADRLDESSAPE